MYLSVVSCPNHFGTPTWDERERAEAIRLAAARVRAALARGDGPMPAHVVERGQRWMLRPLPYPYAVVMD
jgi:hypothetical protein